MVQYRARGTENNVVGRWEPSRLRLKTSRHRWHRSCRNPERGIALKIYVIAPKNPESFWTFDRILPSLGKRCVFPNLALPTVAALTPAPHEVVLCDENVEPIDFDRVARADIVGVSHVEFLNVDRRP